MTNGQTGGDFRILVLVLIGLARFGKTPAIGRGRAAKAGAEAPQDGHRGTQEELSLLVLGLHLAAIDNSAKLQELVAKKVQILVSNRHTDPDFKEGLTREKFPRMAVHGAAELVFPSVHEIAALSLSFPDLGKLRLRASDLMHRWEHQLRGPVHSHARELLCCEALLELWICELLQEKRRTRVWSAVQEHTKNAQASSRAERIPLPETGAAGSKFLWIMLPGFDSDEPPGRRL